MLGHPSLADCRLYLDALVQGGSDFIEVGIPFSDPVADGPVIQAAAASALGAGVRTSDCLELIRDFRSRHRDVPIGVLTYANIAAARGMGRFAGALSDIGADSILLADVPSIEARPYAAIAASAGVDWVMIAAADTPNATLRVISELGCGYTYCVARAGVTGADDHLTLKHDRLFEELLALRAAPPILGFGISNPGQVGQAARSGAAGVICGSAIVNRISSGGSPAQISAFVATLKTAARPSVMAPEGCRREIGRP
jgi:tryptophan synthase alpha chain